MPCWPRPCPRRSRCTACAPCRPGAPSPPGGWKYRFARWQAARLEEKSWRGAAGFVSVSADYLEQLRARYDWFGAKPAALVPFGASEADFELVRSRHDLVAAYPREPGAVHLVSVGVVGPIMRTALEFLFAGVRNLRTTHPAAAARLRLHFIGTSYAPGAQAGLSVLPVAAACGVADLVREEPGRVGYFTAIKTLLAADAIVILGSDDPAYNPSKIATSFLTGRPALALTPAGSALDRMVRELNFAAVASWPAPVGVATATEFLLRLLGHDGTASAAEHNWTAFAAHHTARARTRQQCQLFMRALGFSP